LAKPVFRYYIDFAGTGAFASEVTSVLISAQWQLGFSQPFDLVARDNTAELVVQNITRDFSPEYTSGAYYDNVQPGRAVKITSTYDNVTRTMWLGWIASYQPSVNIKGDRTCKITCSGWFERAQRRESLIPIQLGQTADTVIGVILDESDILPPGISGRWILGVCQRWGRALCLEMFLITSTCWTRATPPSRLRVTGLRIQAYTARSARWLKGKRVDSGRLAGEP